MAAAAQRFSLLLGRPALPPAKRNHLAHAAFTSKIEFRAFDQSVGCPIPIAAKIPTLAPI